MACMAVDRGRVSMITFFTYSLLIYICSTAKSNSDNITLSVVVLRHIYTTSEISVRASESELGRNQNKWIDVSCLHWSESVSETFVSDVRVRARRYM